MAAGFPVKANYVTGDILSAINMNDLAGTLNYLDPTAKGDLFPASDGSTLTRLAVGSNGQILTADSTAATGIKWAAASNGKILQVLSATKTDTASTTSGTFADITGLSISITPAATSSKILITWSAMAGSVPNSTGLQLRLMRDSTAIGIGDAASNRPRISGGFYVGDVTAPGSYAQVAGTFMDSPSSTSSLTYKLQMANSASAVTAYLNRTASDRDTVGYDGRGISTITVMEIAG